MDEAYMALFVSIIKEVSPEEAMRLMEGKKPKKYRKWTAEDYEYIEFLRAEGKTWKQIGQDFGVATTCVQRNYSRWKGGEKRCD